MRAVIVLTLGLALVACSNAPIPNTPAPGEPCGHVEHPCGDGACCANGSACGGGPFSGCPVDSCCFEGGGDDGTLDAVRRTTAKRWPAGSKP